MICCYLRRQVVQGRQLWAATALESMTSYVHARDRWRKVNKRRHRRRQYWHILGVLQYHHHESAQSEEVTGTSTRTALELSTQRHGMLQTGMVFQKSISSVFLNSALLIVHSLVCRYKGAINHNGARSVDSIH